ncbi:MAG: prolyl oligopeptidase family serine peptidase [Verrucomicrobia bacterium]|nr:prolyl oligopeptidase family serine peptidase [Verrucomicrobiota bacterium]
MFEDFGRYEFVGTSNLRMPYRLLAPRDLSSGAKYPLVVLFHGSGERGADNKKQLLNGAARFARPESRTQHPCFVLVPQCPTHLNKQPIMWTGSREEMHELKLAPEPAAPLQTALELLFMIQGKYPIDPERIYVTGISMGGFATWEALIRHPQNFAGAVPVCGGGDVRFADRIKHVPVWAFHGAEDPVVPVICSQSMIENLEKAGGHPRYTEYPGVGHNSWDRAFAEPELLAWLFSQAKWISALEQSDVL